MCEGRWGWRLFCDKWREAARVLHSRLALSYLNISFSVLLSRPLHFIPVGFVWTEKTFRDGTMMIIHVWAAPDALFDPINSANRKAIRRRRFGFERKHFDSPLVLVGWLINQLCWLIEWASHNETSLAGAEGKKVKIGLRVLCSLHVLLQNLMLLLSVSTKTYLVQLEKVFSTP